MSAASELLEELLPSAAGERWFPSSWPTSNWEQAVLVEFDHSAILLARPSCAGPWLQLPVVEAADGSARIEFWNDWVGHSKNPTTVISVRRLEKEQSNSSVILETDRGHWVGKLFRVVYQGNNPDVELPLFLEQRGFSAIAPVRSYLELEVEGTQLTSGVATSLLDNTGTAHDYFCGLAAAGVSPGAPARELGALLTQMQKSLPKSNRVGQPGSLRDRLTSAYAGAKAVTENLSAPVTLPPLEPLLAKADAVSTRVPLQRVHGDLHLGQILHGDDGSWTFIDFEGEPLRPLNERTAPDYALRDLAGLLRSFDYAGPMQTSWAKEARNACLEGYSSFSTEPVDLELLSLLVMEKALYEVQYEAMFRPSWLHIPLRAFS